MLVAARTSKATTSQAGSRTRFNGPVDVYHFTAPKTALADNTDVQLSTPVMAPVPRPVYFIVRIDCVTAYANGDGTAPVVTLKGSLSGSVALTAAGDAAASHSTVQGVLEPNESLYFTPTAGTGSTETGTARVSVTLIDPINGQG